jgi:hypothetical protein
MGEWRYNSTILDLNTRRRLVVSNMSGRFAPGERAPVTRSIGVWVGPRVDLDAVEKRKIADTVLYGNPAFFA